MMLLLIVSEEFWEISAFEEEDNTVPRNVGSDYPLTKRHIPEEWNSQYTAAKNFVILLSFHTTFNFVCYSLRNYPSFDPSFSDDVMNILTITRQPSQIPYRKTNTECPNGVIRRDIFL